MNYEKIYEILNSELFNPDGDILQNIFNEGWEQGRIELIDQLCELGFIPKEMNKFLKSVFVWIGPEADEELRDLQYMRDGKNQRIKKVIDEEKRNIERRMNK